MEIRFEAGPEHDTVVLLMRDIEGTERPLYATIRLFADTSGAGLALALNRLFKELERHITLTAKKVP